VAPAMNAMAVNAWGQYRPCSPRFDGKGQMFGDRKWSRIRRLRLTGDELEVGTGKVLFPVAPVRRELIGRIAVETWEVYLEFHLHLRSIGPVATWVVDGRYGVVRL